MCLNLKGMRRDFQLNLLIKKLPQSTLYGTCCEGNMIKMQLPLSSYHKISSLNLILHQSAMFQLSMSIIETFP